MVDSFGSVAVRGYVITCSFPGRSDAEAPAYMGGPCDPKSLFAMER